MNNSCYYHGIYQIERKYRENLQQGGLWQYRLWSFQGRDIELERFLDKETNSLMKLLNFEN